MDPIVLFRLTTAALLPVLCAVAFYYAEKRSRFKKLSNRAKQTIIGICFGIIAILATEFGIPANGAIMNVRNAAPLTAGLVFGWPAGVISGLVGGIERWFSPSGDYTRLACTLGTIISGFLGAGVRKFMMDNRKSSWFYGLAVGVTSEVLHMLMVFLTNASDMQRAFHVVQIVAIPMIAANGISVMLSMLVISLLGRSGVSSRPAKTENISQTFQRWLLVCVVLAFIVTSIFTHGFQTQLSAATTDIELKTNITDVENDIRDASDRNLLEITRRIEKKLPAEVTQDALRILAEEHDVSEINVIDKNGIIAVSTDEALVGFDMSSGEQAAEFLILLEGTEELVQRYQPISLDSSVYRKYAGVALEESFLQVGYDSAHFQSQIGEQVKYVAQNRHIGQSGSIIICDEQGTIISDRAGHEGENISIFGNGEDRTLVEGQRFTADINGEASYGMYTVAEGYYIIGILPESEALFARNASVYMQSFMEVLVFAMLFAFMFVLVKRLVVENMQEVNASLAQITGGNLEVLVDVRDNEEFASLSDDINSTVATLKHYIAEAAARIDKELEFAKQIQHSALPSVFPPYPNRKDFSIYATMDTAKEVGGDFYDFYLLGEDKLAFLIADVSGKGIPAAMFMMTAKALIKGFAESGLEVNDVFTRANAKLCEGNSAGMFVTAWMGVLDLKTGLVSYANAGHNPPVVRHKDGEYEYLRTRPNFILAGMDGVRYKKFELQLQPGDELYLYTDGVTEAQDSNNELFGEDRLLMSLNERKGLCVEEICRKVKADVDAFVGDADQFDDITMVSVKFSERPEIPTLKIAPSMDTIGQVSAFLEQELEKLEVPMKTANKLQIAMDEIYSNIVRYSGASDAEIQCGAEDGILTLRFRDNGTPYNPLEAEAPDTTLSAEERSIGGLGIFMVRKMMDSVDYMYKDGHNVLTLTLAI